MKRPLTRRHFMHLTAVGASGLVLACSEDGRVKGMSATDQGLPDPDAGLSMGDMGEPDAVPNTDAALPTDVTLQTWIRITEDDQVYIAVQKAEMGQGVHTTLPLIIAEELDVDISQVQIEIVGEMDAYTLGAGLPLTSASNSVRTAYMPFRRVGAAARSVLVQAAALRWAIDVEQITTERGRCISNDGAELMYGALIGEASMLTPPAEPQLKDPADFRLIGQDQIRFIDRQIVEGTAEYGIDSAPEGCLYAAIRHAPTQNGVPLNADELRSSDPAVMAIVGLPNAVAVVADSFWVAKQTVESLAIEFTAPPEDQAVSSAMLKTILMDGLDQDGSQILSQGEFQGVRDTAAQTLTADYYVPHIAHATMEPVNATVSVTADGCEVWAPTQAAFFVRNKVAELTGLGPDQIQVHPTLLGGGFGRKADTDFVEAAIRVAQAVDRPVNLIWSREEDIRRDKFRPCFTGRFEGFLDEAGDMIGLAAKNCGDSVLGFGSGDPLSVQGLNPLAYGIPNQRINHVYLDSPIPSGFWRSIGHSQNTFFAESFIDEMAHLANRDPLEFRRSMLTDNERVRHVLERAALLGSWGTPSVANASQGIALCEDYGSILAVVCDASVDPETKGITVHRLSAAVDCGLAIQPTGVRAQVEGGLIFGLSAALLEEVTFENGQTLESNFYDYEVLLPAQSPEIVVEIVDSSEAPGGMGEIAVGPVGPALANAIFLATGQRCRTLPLQRCLREMV